MDIDYNLILLGLCVLFSNIGNYYITYNNNNNINKYIKNVLNCKLMLIIYMFCMTYIVIRDIRASFIISIIYYSVLTN